MISKKQLESSVDDVLDDAENSEDKLVQFALIWEGTVKPAIGLIKLITGPKMDERLDKLIDAADGLAEGNPDGESKFSLVWNNYQIRSLLKTVQIFTGPKVDKALNKFIDIADTIVGNEEN